MEELDKKIIPMCWKCANRIAKKENRNSVLAGCKVLSDEQFEDRENTCPVVKNYEEHKDLSEV